VGCSVRPTALYTQTDVGWSALCVDKEETYALADDIIREISAITPGPYFHIGGDEVQALTHEQYVHIVERLQTIVNKYGKKMIGWEEITKAKLNPSTLAQQWKSDSATAALQYGSKLIMSPAKKIYLDMKYTRSTELGLNWAAFVEVRDSYDWDPATYMTGVSEANIVGVEGALWSETIRNITAAQYLIMPRLPAIAEVGWTPQRLRDWENFRVRLASQAPRWNLRLGPGCKRRNPQRVLSPRQYDVQDDSRPPRRQPVLGATPGGRDPARYRFSIRTRRHVRRTNTAVEPVASRPAPG